MMSGHLLDIVLSQGIEKKNNWKAKTVISPSFNYWYLCGDTHANY